VSGPTYHQATIDAGTQPGAEHVTAWQLCGPPYGHHRGQSTQALIRDRTAGLHWPYLEQDDGLLVCTCGLLIATDALDDLQQPGHLDPSTGRASVLLLGLSESASSTHGALYRLHCQTCGFHQDHLPAHKALQARERHRLDCPGAPETGAGADDRCPQSG
jgi:hypothetical protein